MAATASQRYLAEFLGTFLLLLFGDGAAVLSLSLWQGSLPLDPNARIVLISASFGIAVVGGAYAFGEISGAHFNPAVTLSMALSRRMPLRDVGPYLVAQVAGAFVGVLTVLGVAYGSAGSWADAQMSGIGSQGYAGAPPYHFAVGAVFLLELALTFLFVLVIQRVTRPESGARNLAPLAIGLTLLVTNLVAIPVDGASINPARSFAPAVLAQIWSGTGWAIQQVWLFWVAPILGGLLASLVDSAFRAPAAPASP
jgi:aquaporin Z